MPLISYQQSPPFTPFPLLPLFPSLAQPLKCVRLSIDLNSALNSSQQRLWVRSYNFLDLLLVLEDQEGGHGTDAEFLGDVGDLVNVELDEVGRGIEVGEPGRK